MPAISTEFNGLKYWKTAGDGYYRRKGVYLHRMVYSGTYGNIPHGWHVHHKDNDRDNNVIENLEALPGKQHNKQHSTGHGVERSQYLRSPVAVSCPHCGTETIKHSHNARFCSRQCKQRFYDANRG